MWELERTKHPESTLASGPKGWLGTVGRAGAEKIMGLKKASSDSVQNDFVGTWLEFSNGW